MPSIQKIFKGPHLRQNFRGLTIGGIDFTELEVAFDGIQTSTRYPGGMALRFARVLRYRDDKTADEADTVDTVRALHRPDPA